MPSGISYKDFKECVKDAHNFESRNHKRYVIAYIEGDTIGLCDPSKKVTYSANLKDIHRAVKEYGADNCTVDVMAKVVGRKAAPMAAALVYTALGDGSLSMVMGDIANMLSSMSDDELDNLLSHFSDDDEFDDEDDDETADDLEDDLEDEAEADDEGEEAPTFTGLSAHLELPKNGRPNTYKQMLGYCDKDDLRDLAYYLDYPEGDFQFSKKRKATMEKEIFRLATEQIERWIDHLPLYDLQLLHDIVIGHRHKIPALAYVPFVVRLGFVQYRVLKGKDSLMECQLCPEIEAALAPHIDAALSRKKSSNTVALDQALWGLINIYGVVPDFVMQKELPRVFKVWGVKVSDDEIDDYLNTAMIPLLCCEYNQDLGLDVYFSHLVPVEAWAGGIDKNVKEGDAAPLEDFDRVKSLGAYPNVSPYSRASRAFYDMLCKYCPKNTADYLFAHFYAQSQRADYAPAAFMKELTDVLGIDIEDPNFDLQAVQGFNNDMPRFYFCGRSSSDMMKMHPDNSSTHVLPTSDLFSTPERSSTPDPTPPLWPKVGRNDPCPCGSGKKFKNCHGRLN